MDLILLYTTFPDSERAKDICQTLLEEKLLACANILGKIESLYTWKETLCSENEVAVLLKTLPEKVVLLRERLQFLHPYEAPALLQISSTSLCHSYNEWIKTVLS